MYFVIYKTNNITITENTVIVKSIFAAANAPLSLARKTFVVHRTKVIARNAKNVSNVELLTFFLYLLNKDIIVIKNARDKIPEPIIGRLFPNVDIARCDVDGCAIFC
jgi:hypothetical protein